jgi:PAS domain S-box-containing protein
MGLSDYKRWLKAPAHVPPADRPRVETALFIQAFSAIVAVLGLVTMPWVTPALALALIVYGTLLVIAIGGWVLLHTRHSLAACRALGFLYWGLVMASIASYGAANSPSLASLPVVLVVVGLLAGGRAALWTTAGSFALVAGFEGLDQAGMLPPAPASPPQERIVTLAFSVALAGSVIHVLQRRIRLAFADVARNRQRFEQLFTGSPDGVLLVDAKGRLVDANPAARRLAEHADVTDGRALEELICPIDADRSLNDVIEAALAGTEVPPFEVQFCDAPDPVPVEASLRRLPGERGEGQLVVALRDLRDRRRAEREREALREQLVHSQKMELVGQLAGGVAHDFNNYLTAIFAAAEMAKLERPAPDVDELLDEVLDAAQASSALTRQLLAFSRRQPLEIEPTQVNELLANSEKLLGRVIGEHIELAFDLDPAAGTALIDPAQLQVVLVNLAVNARDAMPEGGRLTVRSGRRSVERDAEAPRLLLKGGEYAFITVSDTGAGMSEDVARRIFEPFFTTKARGEGTGLGLSTVYGILHDLGGGIDVESEEGSGTTFRVYLPLTSRDASARPNRRTPQAAVDGPVVLVVDDQPQVLDLTARALRKLGYRVHPAAGKDAALALVERLDLRPDVLVSDVVMPGGSGPELAAALDARLGRHVPTLFISGYPGDAVERRGLLPEGASWLPKPFDVATLQARVRALVERPSATDSTG